MTIPQPPHTPAHSIVPLRQRPAWNALKEHYAKVRSLHLRQFFAEDSQRGERFSWLLDLTATALFGHEDLSKFSGRVSDSGEGRWLLLLPSTKVLRPRF